MAAKKGNPAFDFIVAQLEKDRNVAYADIAAAAGKKGLQIYPIMFGRAKALLGLVKVARRGEGKAAKAAGTARGRAAPGRRGPGRPRKSAAAAADSGSIEGIVAAVKASQQEKDRYRSALEKIQQVLAGVLD